MPFFARWPGKVQAGSESAQVITILIYLPPLPPLPAPRSQGAAADGYSFLPLLLGKAKGTLVRRSFIIPLAACSLSVMVMETRSATAPAVANNRAGRHLRNHTFWRTLRHMAMSRKILLKPNRLSRNDSRKFLKIHKNKSLTQSMITTINSVF